MRKAVSIGVGLAALALASGCGDGKGDGDASLLVVATTSQLADFARQVGGERVSVTALVGPGTDPHEYEPRPSAARAVAQADVVLQSGGDVDAWLGDLLDAAGGDARPVTLTDAVHTRPGDGGIDPHWWQDPRNVLVAVEQIRQSFGEADRAGAAAYARNARRYATRVGALDRAIERCISAVPRARRKLVTAHDAFGYFAARYGIEILGSIIPALSSSAKPSARDVRELVAGIRREHVTTIFPETALNPRLEQAVARDAGARVGPSLYADALGPKGSEGATYLGALRHDAAAIGGGFGARCALPAR
ncbi:MAG TPA: zinc ABC transporter substrate-binding protein [Solirubrobacteraceae bacterium]